MDPAGALQGRTIVVTRSREQASSLSSALSAKGAAVIEIPTILIAPPRSYEPLDSALAMLASYDWLVVTSANTARALGERLALQRISPGSQPPTIAVGPATARALEAVGLRVDLVPEPAVAESILAALSGQVRGRRILLARAEVARDLLPQALAEAGAQVTLVDAYRTLPAEASRELARATFGGKGERERAPVDAVTFTSSSTVTNLLALLERAGCVWPAGAKVFSIGPITSGTLREHGIEPTLEAARHDVEGLVQCVVEGLSAT